MVTSRELEAMDVDALLLRGIAAARVGDADDARACLTEVTRRDAANADAWLWLASIEPNPQRMRDHFQRVLALRPGDAEAVAGLDRLTEKYGAGILIPEDETASFYCTWHPNRETRLRCARCGRPMCTECARQHPVGMRCKECKKELRSPIYKVSPLQYVRGFAVGFAASFGLAMLLGALWFFFALFVALALGSAMGDAVGWGAGRKRGRGLQIVAGVSLTLGTLAAIAARYVGAIPLLDALPFSPIGPLVFLVFGLGAAARRLR